MIKDRIELIKIKIKIQEKGENKLKMREGKVRRQRN